MTAGRDDMAAKGCFPHQGEWAVGEVRSGGEVRGPVAPCRGRWGWVGRVAVTAVGLLLAFVEPAHCISDCVYGGTNFSDGAVACQSGLQYRCSNGTWVGIDLKCSEPPPAPTQSKPAECACTANDASNCSAVDMICCVTLEGDKCTKRCCQRP